MILVVFMHVDGRHYAHIAGDGAIATFWDTATSFARPVRMPLFFLISGLLAADAIKKKWKDILFNRVFSLLYIYILWTVILAAHSIFVRHLMYPGFDISESIISSGMNLLWPHAMWFIYALLLYFFVARYIRSTPLFVSLTGAAVLSAASEWLPEPTAPYLARGLLYYLIGAYLPSMVGVVMKRANLLNAVTFGLLFISACALVYFVGKDFFGIWLPAGLIGIIFVLMCSKMLAETRISDALQLIGRTTLPIFLLHTVIILDLNYIMFVLAKDITNNLMSNYLIKAIYPVIINILIIGVILGVHRLAVGVGAQWLFKMPQGLFKSAVASNKLKQA